MIEELLNFPLQKRYDKVLGEMKETLDTAMVTINNLRESSSHMGEDLISVMNKYLTLLKIIKDNKLDNTEKINQLNHYISENVES